MTLIKSFLFFFYLASGFEVVTWNIQKGANKNWHNYIKDNEHVDFWGIQEAKEEMISKDFFLSHHTTFNQAWEILGITTGTFSASYLPPYSTEKVVTEVTEPILNTPKSFLVSRYNSYCDNKTVTVINLHMINFRLGGAYKEQLKQIGQFMSRRGESLIVLGDFNNWNFFRTETLKKWVKKYNLSKASTPLRSYDQGVDHIFYKNLILKDSFQTQPKLSDHSPLHAIFKCMD